MPDEKDLSQFQRKANDFFRKQEADEAAKQKLGKLRSRANKWAAQEKADIQSGAKKVPLTNKEKTMAETNKPLKTALVRETEPGRNRGTLAKNAQELRKAVRVEHRSPVVRQTHSLMAAAETGEAQAFVGVMKPNKSVNVGDPGRQGAQVTRDLLTPQKDLGRAVTNTISRDPEGAPSLMKLAKGRAAKGQSIAGKPGNLDGSRNTLSNALKSRAGKLGGKLGMYGVIKGVIEGTETLRKLKSGAYDLTPEGTAKPKKGVIES